MSMAAVSSSWDVTAAVKFKSLSGCSAAFNPLSASTHNQKTKFSEVPSFRLKGGSNGFKRSKVLLATESSKASADPSTLSSGNLENTVARDQLTSPDVQTDANSRAETSKEVQDSVPKRSPLTVREKLRTARMMSKYTETKPPKQEFGSKVLDALRESDKGKKRSGLPEAPTNLFDDSKRGLPKQGFTFDFPGGSDLLLIITSFVLISTVMFGTTYIVWKSGAIHFNEY